MKKDVFCYLSVIYSNPRASRPFRDAPVGEPGEMESVDVRINIRNANFWKAMIGQPIDDVAIPRRYYKTLAEDEYVGTESHTFPPVFVGLWLFVDDRLRELFIAHGVPADHFTKVDLFQKDGKTRIDAEYWVCVPKISRTTIDIETSESIEKPHRTCEEYRLPSGITHVSSRRHPDIHAIPGMKNVGPLWVDPEFPRVLFFSLALRDALKDAALDELFEFYPVLAPKADVESVSTSPNERSFSRFRSAVADGWRRLKD